MTNTTIESSPTPPYGPFETVKNFIAAVRPALPPVIDQSVLAKYSGTARSHLRTTLKFMSLTRSDGSVTDSFRRMVSAYGTDDWQGTFGDVVLQAYANIIGDLNTDEATLGQLIDRFRVTGGVQGSVLRKAVKFYLSALDEAGLTYSVHFNMRGLSTVTEGSRTIKKKNGGKSAESRRGNAPEDNGDRDRRVPPRAVPEGVEEVMVPLPGRDPILIHLPDDLTDAEWAFVEMFVKSYMKLREQQ